MRQFQISNFKFQKKEDGFTLLEMIIAIFVFTAILGLVLTLGFDISGLNNFLGENIITQNEIQLTLNGLVTELRSMGPSSIGGYPIEAAGTNYLTFFSDLDQDGLFERVRYYMNGATFMRGVIKPSGSPLTYNPANEKTTEAIHYIVSNPASVFSYYEKQTISSDPPMTAPIDPYLIRSIKVSLTSDRNGAAEPGPLAYEIFATIRNFRMTE